MANPVKLVATLAARPGKAGELQALLDGMVASCRAEPGNLRWDIWRSQGEAGPVFVLDELYVDAAAVAAHRGTAHFAHYISKINDLAERRVQVLDPTAVAD